MKSNTTVGNVQNTLDQARRSTPGMVCPICGLPLVLLRSSSLHLLPGRLSLPRLFHPPRGPGCTPKSCSRGLPGVHQVFFPQRCALFLHILLRRNIIIHFEFYLVCIWRFNSHAGFFFTNDRVNLSQVVSFVSGLDSFMSASAIAKKELTSYGSQWKSIKHILWPIKCYPNPSQ